MNRIKIVKADITTLEVDVIVNAANASLLGGGGVDGAIHRAAGPELLKACERLGGCPTGEAKITKGFNLPAKYVIHTVGPIWQGGSNNEENLLADCYLNSFELAVEYDCKSIAFPNISTGIYHFPKQLAATIALREIGDLLSYNYSIEQVYFVCFDEENFGFYNELIGVTNSC